MKLNHLTILMAFILGLILSGCHSTRSLSGQTYITNFPSLGFMSTSLTFDSDSTYKKHFSGDGISRKDSGIYQITHRRLLIKYKVPPVDSSFYIMMKKMGTKMNIDSFVKVDSLDKERTEFETFYLRGDKIFFSKQNGRISRKDFGYSKRKKYIIFGSHYYNRKHYLKKRE